MIFVLFVAAIVLYYPVFQWTFWKDDWWFLWGSFTHNPRFLTNIIQPGTVLQFLVCWPLFGVHPLPYMIIGLAAKIIYACVIGLLCSKLISPRVKFPAALLALLLPIGIDAVGWPSAHVTIVSATVLLIGFLLVLAKQKRRLMGYFLLVLSFALDPGRILPVVICIFGFLYYKKMMKRKIIVTLLAGAGIIAALVLWRMRPMLSDIQVVKYINLILSTKSLSSFARTWKYSFGYFASLGNLLYGSFIILPNYLATGVYSRAIAVVGFGSIALLFTGAWYIYKKKHDAIPLFALSWMTIGYVTPWLFEPRQTLSVYHRYMVIPGIGLILLITWILNQLRSQKIRWLLVIIILLFGIRTSLQFIHSQSPFRNASRTDEFFRFLLTEEKKYSPPIIFYVVGSDRFIPSALSFAQNLPLALYSPRKNMSEVPFVAILPEGLLHYECGMKNAFTVVTIRMDEHEPVRMEKTEVIRRRSLNCK